jgi:hypothetical protein
LLADRQPDRAERGPLDLRTRTARPENADRST